MKTTEHQTRVRPQPGATRCPFCHDDCAETEDVAVCRACRSRHHSDCWAEAGECSSCSASEYLGVPAERTETEVETETESDGASAGARLAAAAAVVALAAIL